MIPNPIKLLLALFLAGGAPLAHARVVINEIMYHAPDDLDDLQFIELHNSGNGTVDLSGWTFTKGIKFKFAAGARIEAKGFLVLCRNVERFKEFYPAPVAGRFESAIRRKGERVELTDASGQVVDAVKFKDSAPWPTGADGYSGSLERISPEAASDNAANWASSPLAEDRDKPAGTPGQSNACFSAQLPPVIEQVKFIPEHPAPNEAITVEAVVRDVGGAVEVKLRFRIAGPGFEQPESGVAMHKVAENRYAATIPGQAAEQLIRFRIQATGARGAQRFFPAETEPRPALSAYVQVTIAPARIPFGWILQTTEAEFKAAQQRANTPDGGGFGGFGPGGFPGGGPPPDPLAPVRAQARAALERGLDLSWPWFEITVNTPGADVALSDLKALFVAKLAERNRFIDDQIARRTTEEQLQIRPEVIRSFLQELADTARPQLDETQNRAFAAWLAKASSEAAAPFATMINRRVDLEGAWHAVTLNAEIDPARLAGHRQTLREFDQQRRVLLAEVASGQGQDSGFRDQRDRADTLGEKLVATLGAQLSPAQAKQFDAWRTSPREITVGLRTVPPMMDGPSPGFAGGPGGFGGRGPFGQEAAAPGSHHSAFVYFDPATSKTELFDFVQITPRKGGQKIHLLKDQPLRGMTVINLVFEDETASLVEPLAYEVYRRVGLAAEQSYHVRLWQSGRPVGYHLLIEQPNRAFLRRNQVRDDGNMYKLLWYENGVVGQHEKKTNTRAGHDDIVALIDALEKTTGDAQWEVIRKNFEVAQVANFFAVNTVLSHWDGFFNNYFTYHDTQGTGKWTMYPWDQDSTWGLRDMTGTGQVFYDMPITFGMNGDAPPPGGGWWRSPGWFSGPLLANSQFRKIFLAHTKEILETVYTEEVFTPIIAAMARRLEPEVKIRAEILKQDPARATQRLRNDLDGALQHLRQRREFLLAQDEFKSAGKSSRTGQAAPAAQ